MRIVRILLITLAAVFLFSCDVRIEGTFSETKQSDDLTIYHWLTNENGVYATHDLIVSQTLGNTYYITKWDDIRTNKKKGQEEYKNVLFSKATDEYGRVSLITIDKKRYVQNR